MRVVVDTNVLVSGLLTPGGTPGIIINMIAEGDLRVCHDPRIFAEYGAVLGRPEFNISANSIAELLDQIITSGESIQASPLFSRLPDRRDELFLEVAVAGKVSCLITGNRKHFPLSACRELTVLSPAEFLELYRSRRDSSFGGIKCSSVEYRTQKSKKSFKGGRRDDQKPEMSFDEFCRRVDRVSDVGDTKWTSEEVTHVIHGIRQKTMTGKSKPQKIKAIKNSSR